jgi:hypothetical protein
VVVPKVNQDKRDLLEDRFLSKRASSATEKETGIEQEEGIKIKLKVSKIKNVTYLRNFMFQ